MRNNHLGHFHNNGHKVSSPNSLNNFPILRLIKYLQAADVGSTGEGDGLHPVSPDNPPMCALVTHQRVREQPLVRPLGKPSSPPTNPDNSLYGHCSLSRARVPLKMSKVRDV